MGGSIGKENVMETLSNAVKTGARKITVLGVVAVILGILAILMPFLAGASAALLVGVFVLAAGIVRIVWAFGSDRLGKGLLRFALGVLTLLCGVVLLANPLFAMGILTIMLAIYLFIDGISEIVAGIMRRPQLGWLWMLIGGVVSILLGFFIWRQFPLSGVWAIGILLGIKLLFVGLIMLTAGSVVRAASKE
jgi:uncharacterized membrane protein HdeD (DUF308 family)